jgi:hypothetical protein
MRVCLAVGAAGEDARPFDFAQSGLTAAGDGDATRLS